MSTTVALSLYEKHQDKTRGLVNRISFVVMQNRKISVALALDRHFLQAGFTLAQRSAAAGGGNARPR
jgi:uncharacterized protein